MNAQLLKTFLGYRRVEHLLVKGIFVLANGCKLFRLLLNGCPLIAVHKARYFKREDGLALGPGPFAAALEYAAGVTATTVGKPESSFFQTALADMELQAENTVIIGDVC